MEAQAEARGSLAGERGRSARGLSSVVAGRGGARTASAWWWRDGAQQDGRIVQTHATMMPPLDLAKRRIEPAGQSRRPGSVRGKPL